MAEKLIDSDYLNKVGTFVREQFENGSSYVHLHHVPLFNVEDGIEDITGEASLDTAESEASAHLQLKRYRNMLHICRTLAELQNGTFDPLQGLEIVGERKNGSTMVVEKDAVPFHTEEATVSDPSRVVSYWNAQTLGTPSADVITILPLNRIIQRTIYRPELRDPHPFVGDGYVYAPVINRKAKTVRHDPGQIWAEGANKLFEEFGKDKGLIKKITLKPGDVLFIDNHRALHSADHYKFPDRLTYKLLHYALMGEAIASTEEEEIMQEAFLAS